MPDFYHRGYGWRFNRFYKINKNSPDSVGTRVYSNSVTLNEGECLVAGGGFTPITHYGDEFAVRYCKFDFYVLSTSENCGIKTIAYPFLPSSVTYSNISSISYSVNLGIDTYGTFIGPVSKSSYGDSIGSIMIECFSGSITISLLTESEDGQGDYEYWSDFSIFYQYSDIIREVNPSAYANQTYYYCSGEGETDKPTELQAKSVYHTNLSGDSRYSSVSFLIHSDSPQLVPAESVDGINWFASIPDPGGSIYFDVVFGFYNYGVSWTTSENYKSSYFIPAPPPPPPVPTAPSSTALTPSGISILDASADITFSWSTYNRTDLPVLTTDIQISRDNGSTWQDLVTLEGDALTYLCPADTLISGSYLWRVRGTNDVGTGQWSNTPSFTALAALRVYNLQITPSPLALITWELSEEQLSAEVEIDGVVYPVFGNQKFFRVSRPLELGPHFVRVRCKNHYMFSEWFEKSFTVVNSPAAGSSITLTTETSSYSSQLNWSVSGDFLEFYVLRNDKIISRGSSRAYLDDFGSGTNIYLVRGIQDEEGNYVESNLTVSTLKFDGTVIKGISDPNWLHYSLTDKSMPQKVTSFEAGTSYRHVMGARFPVAELSGFFDVSKNFNFAVKDSEEGRKLEQLVGSVVAVKDNDSCIIGVLSELTKIKEIFYTTYNLTIRQIEYDEASR